MIDVAAIKSRFDAVSPFLDERGRRLVAASEALAAGRGGIQAACAATAVARSTIGRGLVGLRGGENHLGGPVRRAGGGRKAAVDRQAGLLEALAGLVQPAIRGDPQAALLWVSRSRRHLAGALAERGFTASHTTSPGLAVRCRLDENDYPKAIGGSDAEMAEINIEPDDFHGE